ncbi:MAG TPA: hypothetical protein DCE41_01160 [Cytophagales bacterium]|nr:hypothetical protein [Cytophagales bacterium]
MPFQSHTNLPLLPQSQSQKSRQSQTKQARQKEEWSLSPHDYALVDRNTFTPQPKAEIQDKAFFMQDEQQVLQARWDMLRREKQEVFASYYLFDGNRLGRIALAELRQAAQRGARGRLVVDQVAVDAWRDEKIDLYTLKALQEDGVEIRQFHPVSFYNPMHYFDWRSYSRLHDKLLYLGGQQVLFTGDRNMQNFNFRSQNSKGKRGMSYRSVEVMTQGSMVEEVLPRMEQVWAESQPYVLENLDTRMVDRARMHLERALAWAQERFPTNPANWADTLQPVNRIEFVGDNPALKGQVFPIDERVIHMIQLAKQKIVIMSPYINLSRLYRRLLQEAIGRGVEVQLITASRASNDNGFSFCIFSTQVKALRKMGIKIFYHQGPDFLHAKMFVVDEEKVLLGAHNFNHRSTYNDVESGVIIRDRLWVKRQIGAFLGQIRRESNTLPDEKPQTLGQCLSFAGGRIMRMIPWWWKQW